MELEHPYTLEYAQLFTMQGRPGVGREAGKSARPRQLSQGRGISVGTVKSSRVHPSRPLARSTCQHSRTEHNSQSVSLLYTGLVLGTTKLVVGLESLSGSRSPWAIPSYSMKGIHP